MSAKPKPEHDLPHKEQSTPPAENGKADLGPVIPGQDVDAAQAASPARELQGELQDRLEEKMQPEPRRAYLTDIGRVLAASSGITMILGAFIFTGIW